MTSLFLSVCLSAELLGNPVPPPVLLPAPLPAPPVIVQPVPVPVVPLVPAIPTMKEFFGRFQPLPGNYEIVVLHPKSNCPVKVCFSLPDCAIRNYHVNHRSVEIEYQNGTEVEIIFRLFGKVDVKYHD